MKEQDLRSIRNSLKKLVGRIDIILEDKDDGESFEKMTMSEKEDYIIKNACIFWGIEKKDLLKKNNTLAKRRGYVCVLLRDYAHMGQEDIGMALKYNNHSSITKQLKNMDEKLSSEPWGDGRMRAVYKSILEYLNLKPIK